MSEKNPIKLTTDATVYVTAGHIFSSLRAFEAAYNVPLLKFLRLLVEEQLEDVSFTKNHCVFDARINHSEPTVVDVWIAYYDKDEDGSLSEKKIRFSIPIGELRTLELISP